MWVRVNIYFLIIAIILIVIASVVSGWFGGKMHATQKYNDRCMKYFGYKGYPADGYCKLFIGEVKARDE